MAVQEFASIAAVYMAVQEFAAIVTVYMAVQEFYYDRKVFRILPKRGFRRLQGDAVA